jgi:uncharacterized protein (TIGR02246 family)
MAAEDEIMQLLARYERALNDGDAELAAACYTADGVFLAPALPTIAGQELADGYARIFDAIRLEDTFAVDELVVAGDSAAYALTRSNGLQAIRGSVAASTAAASRELFVFRLQDEGWKIARCMFNAAA